MQRITPFLWFDSQAEEAAKLYVSIFPNSTILNVSRSGEDGREKPGKVMSISFRLEGLEFMALNGGPVFTFNPAISLFVSCTKQEEVDELWARLSEGGSKGQCGWLQDRFGISWQIVPAQLGELLGAPDRASADRVMKAMLGMTKLDIAGLQKAALSTP